MKEGFGMDMTDWNLVNEILQELIKIRQYLEALSKDKL